MSTHAVSRLAPDSSGHNTINLRTVKLFFQKSPGKPKGDKRGISELEFRVATGGVTARSVTTDKDGLLEVPVESGEAKLELLHQGQTVSMYEITVDDSPLAVADTLLGQQQRLRFLGYQLGRGGPADDGVGVDAPPKDITPSRPKEPDPEEDEDDRKAAEKRKIKKLRSSVQAEAFEKLTFRTERSILDFQADAQIFLDGSPGKTTQSKLIQEVGE